MDDAAIEERLAAFVAGELGAQERAQVQAYLDEHPQWLAVLAAVAPRHVHPRGPGKAAEAPDRLSSADGA